MSDKTKAFVTPSVKTMKTKRPSTVSVSASSSRGKYPSTAVKEKKIVARPRVNKNATVLEEADTTILKEGCMPDFDAEYRQVAYGKFLRAMLEDCLVEDKIEREETQIDLQLAQLAERFQKTMDQLDKTNKRLKDISFVVEQKRLLDLKHNDCIKFYETIDNSNAQELLNDLKVTEQSFLDKLETKNVDLGYNKQSGHKQLLDAVNDAIEGLEQIKKHSNLDMDKFTEYKESREHLAEVEKDRLDLEHLKADFKSKFPQFGEKLMKEVSDKIAKMMQYDEDDEEYSD